MGEEELPEHDDYLNNTTTTEIENHYQLKQEIQKRLKLDELENTSDYEDNDTYKKVYAKRNSNTSTNDNSDIDYDTDDDMHVDGLVSKLKSKRVKELEAQLTRDQLEEEKRIEREQLAAIFELLKKQEAELNMKEIDESELNAQLALYR
ncbi:hypothetical protein CVS40_11460 [Lucilia cuprina]|nr:hypothetical protein CVS40_11460 [Lucilia cuprina]